MTTLRTLVSAAELTELVRRGGVLVVDCRFDLADPGKGERDYLAAHVPGAVYAHLDRDLSDASRRGFGRHPLPEAAAFSAVLSRWGWTPDTDVVAYDDAGGALAASRLWWLMRLAGHERAAVLDGGFAAWRAAGGRTESGPAPQRAPGMAQVEFAQRMVVGYDELQHGLAQRSVLLLDGRAAARYRGEVEPVDRVAGHVPGASNRPYTENLDASGRFQPPAQLRREYVAVLAGRAPDEVVHMCGSGVTACHNLLAMEHAGLAGSRVFAPSWSGWIEDPARPVATGAQPG
jgi:thiosulfate/3-mercaptopyruvate sulfurtransferase